MPDHLAVCNALGMGIVKRIAPIFPATTSTGPWTTTNGWGFTTRAYEGGGYAFATRDGIEIHLGLVPEHHSGTARPTSGSTTPMSWLRPGGPQA